MSTNWLAQLERESSWEACLANCQVVSLVGLVHCYIEIWIFGYAGLGFVGH